MLLKSNDWKQREGIFVKKRRIEEWPFVLHGSFLTVG